jgi:hypothetical protein
MVVNEYPCVPRGQYGEDKDVELGAVLWVEFHEWQEKE